LIEIIIFRFPAGGDFQSSIFSYRLGGIPGPSVCLFELEVYTCIFFIASIISLTEKPYP